jgi:ubiquitin carboxyl-terminal hydrolase L5
VLQRRIEAYQMGEIRFNLMAICREKATLLREQEEELQAQLFSLTEEQAAEASGLEAELARVQQALASESSKRQRWEVCCAPAHEPATQKKQYNR